MINAACWLVDILLVSIIYIVLYILAVRVANWNVQFWVLLSLSTMISKINTKLNKGTCAHPLVIVHFDSFERNENLSRLPQIFSRNWAAACYSCGWFYPVADPIPSGWIRVAAISIPDSWIQVTFESSSDGWIQVTADTILRLTRVPAAGYELQLILSCS